jgi:hypothetical protein
LLWDLAGHSSGDNAKERDRRSRNFEWNAPANDRGYNAN